MTAKRISFIFIFFNFFLSSSSFAVLIDDDEVPLHQVSAKQCRLCHMEIYEQWQGSMHAKSTALSDPIHRAFYKKVIGDPTKEGVRTKKGKYPICLQCHAPNAAQDKKTKLDAMDAYSEGVNCLVCHRLKKFIGTRKKDGKLRLGLQAYETSEKCQGPSGFISSLTEDGSKAEAIVGDDKKENPHIQKPYVSNEDAEEMMLPLDANPSLLKTSEACLGCHDTRKNFNGVPLCATGDEYASGKTFVTCQSCHMPVANGFANHSMGGGHDLSTLKRAIVLKLNTEKAADKIKASISLHNQQPHKVPTGAPFRNMSLRVTAYDINGKLLWANYKKHPAKEDPKAYFDMKLKDKDGHYTTPPKATSLGPDNRMKPYEKRKLNYEFPARGVNLVRVELYYNLLWPGLNKKMKFLPNHLREAKRISFAEQRIK